MDTKSMIDLYLEEVRGCKDDSLLLTEEQLAELQREYQAQCQEVDRLKELLCVAQDYLEQHWDMRSVPLREIDDIANRHLAEAALKDKQ